MIRALFVVSLGLVLATSAQAATITILPGSGFTDTTPVTPTGGNTATTLGQARLQLFQHAAQLWGARLTSSQVIYASVDFTTLTCSSSSGLLGQASPVAFFKNFTHAPLSNVYYAEALANALEGKRIDNSNPTTNSATADIQADFNSAIDGNPSCLGGIGFYYGFDNNPGSKIDLLNVVMHEFGHGLGFDSLVNPTTGAGEDSSNPTVLAAYDQFVYDETQSLFWRQMSASQRVASAVNNGHLVFNGAQVNSATPVISPGVTSAGHLRLYAPNPVQQGSSVAHWDSNAELSLLLRPFDDPAQKASTGVDVTICALVDMGWVMAPGVLCPDIPSSYPAPVANSQSVSTAENTLVNITLSGSSSKGAALSYNVTTSPTNGGLSGTAPNLVYTPNANYSGTDSFQFTVSDGTKTSPAATVSIQVTSPATTPPAPSASSKSGGGGAMPCLLLFAMLAAARRLLLRRRNANLA